MAVPPVYDGRSLCVQITELSKEVFRLKEALGALSPPLGITSMSPSSSPTHHNNPGQQMALQNRIATLTQQLQVRRTLTRGMYEVLMNWLMSIDFFSVTFMQDWERKHKQVVTIYRSHLLAAVQVSWMDTNMPEHRLRLKSVPWDVKR